MKSSNMLAGRIVLLVGLAGGSAAVPLAAQQRSIDGSDNNLFHPEWGQAGTTMLRLTPPDYADGAGVPSGEDRPNPRMISNAVCAQVEPRYSAGDLSNWVWQWGQFVDHDITLVEVANPAEPMPVEVPMGDPMFDPARTGAAAIGLSRSAFDAASGNDDDNPREQMNFISAYLDGSTVYSSDPQRAAWLRAGVRGLLKTGPDNLLPFNDGTQLNAGPGNRLDASPQLVVAGDVRANEQSGLIAVHTLMMREHNRRATALARIHPDWTDEQLYQRARKEVGAVIQVITYHEFLPALLGDLAPNPAGFAYDPTVNVGIANVFSTACYRIGHTMLPFELPRMDAAGATIAAGNLRLRDAFFNPGLIIAASDAEHLWMGFALERMQEIDPFLVDDVRNFLFGPPGSGGFDLASLNIQRGRDHGLPDYNIVRESFGLAGKPSFEAISSDPEIVARLASIYADVDQVDPWIGGLCEDHLPGAQVGELMATVLAEQFARLRDGDRFWYAHDPALSPAEIAALSEVRLADVIRANSTLTDLPDDVFRARVRQDPPPPDGGSDGGATDDPVSSVCGIMGLANVGLLLLGLFGLRLVRRR